MTDAALADRIAARIRAEGPLSVAAYMAMALYDRELGYYATRRPIGTGGDFVTAPEISQIFGELIGLWCVLMWQEMGRPDPVILAEFGPGSGALAADLLRAAGVVPEFRRAIRLHLVEISPVLRADQQHRLDAADAVWVTRLEELPEGPRLVIANEFLDALPIRQLVRGVNQWTERLVTVDQCGRLVFAEGAENSALSLLVPAKFRLSASAGAVFEICPAALALGASLGGQLKHSLGAALFFDYGRPAGGFGASLRAVRSHRFADPLAAPGKADLSADVDFAAFAETAHRAGAEVFGPVLQRDFLQRLGATARLARLGARVAPVQRQQLESGLHRLLDPEQMGTLFKVLALTSKGLPKPPGFDDTEPVR